MVKRLWPKKSVSVLALERTLTAENRQASLQQVLFSTLALMDLACDQSDKHLQRSAPCQARCGGARGGAHADSPRAWDLCLVTVAEVRMERGLLRRLGGPKEDVCLCLGWPWGRGQLGGRLPEGAPEEAFYQHREPLCKDLKTSRGALRVGSKLSTDLQGQREGGLA